MKLLINLALNKDNKLNVNVLYCVTNTKSKIKKAVTKVTALKIKLQQL